MAALARQGSQNPSLRRLADEVCRWLAVAPHAICWDRFVRGAFRFRDESREVVRTIDYTLNDYLARGVIEGDCDDVATFHAAGLLALGYPVRLVAIRTDSLLPDFLHVYVEGYIENVWRRFDPTVDEEIVDREIDYGRLVEVV